MPYKKEIGAMRAKEKPTPPNERGRERRERRTNAVQEGDGCDACERKSKEGLSKGRREKRCWAAPRASAERNTNCDYRQESRNHAIEGIRTRKMAIRQTDAKPAAKTERTCRNYAKGTEKTQPEAKQATESNRAGNTREMSALKPNEEAERPALGHAKAPRSGGPESAKK